MFIYLEDDFVTDCDLFIACIILQKQIEYINGNKNNIIVPSIKMKLIRDGDQSGWYTAILASDLSIFEHLSTGTLSGEQLTSLAVSTEPESNSTAKAKNESSARVTSMVEPMTRQTSNKSAKADETPSGTKSSVHNPCVLCWNEEKRLACIPCGHLVVCVSCGQTIRTCPTCRKEIEAFVRVYM